MKVLKPCLALLCVAFATTPLLAAASIDQHLVGSLKLIGSPKGSSSFATPLELLELPNVTLPFNIAPLSTKNQLRSTFEWAGKTAVGTNLSWSLSGPGEATADWEAGKITFDLPFILVVNGVRIPVRAAFTSEPGSDAFGPHGGSVRKVSDSVAEVTLVSNVTFAFNWKDLFPNGENKRDEWVGRITFVGRLEALNGGKLF